MKNRIEIANVFVIVGVLFALVSGYQMYRDPMPAGIFAASDAADLGQRCFEPLQPALKGTRVAGYVSSRPLTSANDMGAYFLAQYYLAPTVLLPGARRPVVLANLDTQEQLENLMRNAGLEMVQQSHPQLNLQVQPGVAVLRQRMGP